MKAHVSKCPNIHPHRIGNPSDFDTIIDTGSVLEVRKVTSKSAKDLKKSLVVVDAQINTMFEFNQFSLSTSLEEVAQTLTEGLSTPIEKIRAFYFWMGKNISFDGVNGMVKSLDVLRTQKGISEGYANLFAEFCRSVGIKCEKVVGFYKNYRNLEVLGRPNHIWNRVYITEIGWQLIDTAIGGDFHFLAEPKEFIYTHLPLKSGNQILSPPISKNEFRNMVYLHSTFFEYKIEPFSKNSYRFLRPLLSNYATIRFRYLRKCKHKDFNKVVKIKYLGNKQLCLNQKDNSYKIITEYKSGFAFTFFMPYKGLYEVQLYLSPRDEKKHKLAAVYKFHVPKHFGYEVALYRQVSLIDAIDVLVLSPVQAQLRYDTRCRFRFYIGREICGLCVQVGNNTAYNIDYDTFRFKVRENTYEKWIVLREMKGRKKIVSKRFPLKCRVKVKIALDRRKYIWVDVVEYDIVNVKFPMIDMNEDVWDDDGEFREIMGRGTKNVEKQIVKNIVFGKMLNFHENNYSDMYSYIKSYGPLLNYGRSIGFEVVTPKKSVCVIEVGDPLTLSFKLPFDFHLEKNFYDCYLTVHYFKRFQTSYNVHYFDLDNNHVSASICFNRRGRYVVEYSTRDVVNQSYRFIAKWIVKVVGRDDRNEQWEEDRIFQVGQSVPDCFQVPENRESSISLLTPLRTDMKYDVGIDIIYRINEMEDKIFPEKIKLSKANPYHTLKNPNEHLGKPAIKLYFGEKNFDRFDMSFIPTEDDFAYIKRSTYMEKARVNVFKDSKRMIRIYGENTYKMNFALQNKEKYGFLFKCYNFLEELDNVIFVDENSKGEVDVYVKFPRKDIYRVSMKIKEYVVDEKAKKKEVNARRKYNVRKGTDYWILCF